MAIILTLTAIIWSDANPGQYRSGLNAFVVGVRSSTFHVLSLVLSFFCLSLCSAQLYMHGLFSKQKPTNAHAQLRLQTQLLWLKVLAFLKIVNKQMSTFIYAVSLALTQNLTISF